MHRLLALGLILLGGCTLAPQPADISGLWINQAAIDSAAQGRPLLRAIDAHGLNLEHVAGQVFERPARPAPASGQWGTTFRQALNSAYMGGQWTIIEGQGIGHTVEFKADGSLSGLAQNDRYELCLGGDCATQGAGNDTLYLGKGNVGDGWIFVRYGRRMEILKAINQSQPDEIPRLAPGPRQWLLEK